MAHALTRGLLMRVQSEADHAELRATIADILGSDPDDICVAFDRHLELGSAFDGRELIEDLLEPLMRTRRTCRRPDASASEAPRAEAAAPMSVEDAQHILRSALYGDAAFDEGDVVFVCVMESLSQHLNIPAHPVQRVARAVLRTMSHGVIPDRALCAAAERLARRRGVLESAPVSSFMDRLV